MDILIIEDDLLFASRLEAILAETTFNLVGHCNSAEEAKKWLINNVCDVALIDIHLGAGPNGIEISKEFKKLSVPIIFMTAFPSDEIYNESLLDNESYFLVKPFDKFTLKSVLNKIELKNKGLSFVVKDNNQLIKIAWEDFMYLEVEGNYCIFNLSNKRIIVKKSLTKFLIEINNQKSILRIHRNFAVNLKKIGKINTKDLWLDISSKRIPIGATFLNSLSTRVKDTQI